MILNEYGQPYTRYIPGVERYLDGTAYNNDNEYLAAINSRMKELQRLAASIAKHDNSTLGWSDPIKA